MEFVRHLLWGAAFLFLVVAVVGTLAKASRR